MALVRITQRPAPPLIDEIDLKFSDQAVRELEAIASRYPERKAAILPGLWIAQREYGGHLTPEAIAEVAHRLSRSFAEVEGVATFYTMYNKAPVGQFMIEVCTNLTCMVCGAYPLLKKFEETLGIRLGETTEDGLFTPTEAECLNNCGDAPVVQVGDVYYRKVGIDQVEAMIDELKAGETRTVVGLADAIVKVHLREGEVEKQG